MRTRNLLTTLAGAVALLAASSSFAQQASLTLRNCDAAFCNHNNTPWTLTKTGSYTETSPGVGVVVWTVTTTRGVTSDNIIEVSGFITIENTGTANATIGNIVVNLQKRAIFNQPTWVSAAADMADATVGTAATKANIAKAASLEDPAANAAVGANNYTTPGGGLGVFIKTAGSGTVQFTDVSDNTVYALVPQKVIPPGGLVNLKYTATFNNTVLGLADGAQVRSETIVSFGNAGGRGDSGASSPNIDINGSGVIDPDEAHVRSVPCRISKDLPALERCNNTVTLMDTDPDSLTTSGSLTYSGFVTDIGGGTGIAQLSASSTNTVVVVVNGGDDGGKICNTAYLDGESSSVTAGEYTFPCCEAVDLEALSCVEVGPTPPGGFGNGDFCTFTQGGWGAPPNGNNPATTLSNNFSTVYPSGYLVIGGNKTITFTNKTSVVNGEAQNLSQIPDGAFDIVETGLANPKYTYKVGVTVTAVGAILEFLPAGGTPDALTDNLENPTSTSAGVFAGQVLALELNVSFSAAGITQGPGGPLGNLTLCNTGSAADGQTVSQILAAANVALGGGAVPYGMTISQLNDLITKLNEAFDNCTTTDWASSYLCP